jgi:SAM-dependent methyltransferase
MIDPKQLAKETSVEHLSWTADNYFKSLSDPTPWMIKPFSSLVEAPELLQNVGLLLSGLYLGKTMTVLDFGAGSCWFSRILSQLQCQTISCDVSDAALEIGKRLFMQLPLLGDGVFEPRFLPFDGKHIDLPDNTVDRIACNDAFHHVPNQQLVLSEFARILQPGGIAGFSEPGKYHSSKPQTQMEMKNYGVLENDIDLIEICALAKEVGFSRASCKLLNNMELTLEEYNTLLNNPREGPLVHGDMVALEKTALSNIRQTMAEKTIFFLFKGEFLPDSRGHVGLSHIIDIEKSEFETSHGEPLHVDVTISNHGTAQWLTENVYGVGVVKLGTHLYDEKGNLLALDFSRHGLGDNVLPNQKVRTRALLHFPARGTFTVALDLVSEGVSWFETLGSQPKYVRVRVT